MFIESRSGNHGAPVHSNAAPAPSVRQLAPAGSDVIVLFRFWDAGC
jgi:hypothetical protein